MWFRTQPLGKGISHAIAHSVPSADTNRTNLLRSHVVDAHRNADPPNVVSQRSRFEKVRSTVAFRAAAIAAKGVNRDGIRVRHAKTTLEFAVFLYSRIPAPASKLSSGS